MMSHACTENLKNPTLKVSQEWGGGDAGCAVAAWDKAASFDSQVGIRVVPGSGEEGAVGGTVAWFT